MKTRTCAYVRKRGRTHAHGTDKSLRLSSMMKNLCDLCFGALAFWSVGWALAYGVDAHNADNVNGFCGTGQFFLIQGYDYSMWM